MKLVLALLGIAISVFLILASPELEGMGRARLGSIAIVVGALLFVAALGVFVLELFGKERERDGP